MTTTVDTRRLKVNIRPFLCAHAVEPYFGKALLFGCNGDGEAATGIKALNIWVF